MAGELSYEIRRTHSPGFQTAVTRTTGNLATDQATRAVWSNTVSVGTSEESIDFSSVAADISTRGRLFICNADATNFINYGSATTEYTAKVLPGEWDAIGWNPSETTIYLKADTAACLVYLELYSR